MQQLFVPFWPYWFFGTLLGFCKGAEESDLAYMFDLNLCHAAFNPLQKYWIKDHSIIASKQNGGGLSDILNHKVPTPAPIDGIRYYTREGEK